MMEHSTMQDNKTKPSSQSVQGNGTLVPFGCRTINGCADVVVFADSYPFPLDS